MFPSNKKSDKKPMNIGWETVSPPPLRHPCVMLTCHVVILIEKAVNENICPCFTSIVNHFFSIFSFGLHQLHSFPTKPLSGPQMKVDQLHHPFSPELNIGGRDCVIGMPRRVPVDVPT